jgi:flagellar hook-associated protein 3 FlgL
MSISSLSFNAATRATIMRVQSDLRDASSELSSGRLVDVGNTLGRLTGEAVQYHSQESTIQKMLDSNKLVTSRLELMDDTLDSLRTQSETVSGALTTLMSDVNNAVAVSAVKDTAKASLEAMIGSLNVNVTGQYLFAGAQTDQTPLDDASAEVAANFKDYLAALPPIAGVPVTAATVTASQLEQYFSKDGVLIAGKTHRFDAAFEDPNWGDWSNASDTPVVSRISKNETIESSLTTNEQAFRKITAAYSLLGSVGMEGMNEAARREVANAALTRLNAGKDGLIQLQAQVGTRINRVTLADTALNTQKDLVKAAIERLEGVDPTEASLRVTTLETQLQASYTVTGRLKNLSLLNYL